MANPVTFTTTLGPDITFKGPDGTTLLTAISSASVVFNTVDSTAEATGSGNVNGGVLNLTFDVPKGTQGDKGDTVVGPAGPTATISVASSGALAFSEDGSPICYTFTPTAATTLTLSGGVAGQLCEIILYVKQGSTSFAVTMPTGCTVLNSAAITNTANVVSAVRFGTVDGGATYFVGPF